LVFELGDWTDLCSCGCLGPFPCNYIFDVQQSPTVTAEISVQVNSAGEAIPGTVQVFNSTDGWIEGGMLIITQTDIPLCGCPTIGTISGSGVRSKTLVNQNTLGWYSWKVVVKQTEQDYYNCYLPGILAGYPKDLTKNDDEFAAVDFPKGDENNTAHIVLINDNINKIPRDLSKVGPQQKIFGSSVKLYGRVENYKYNDGVWNTYNRQFDPETLPDTVVNIGTISTMELGGKVQCGSDNNTAAPFSYPTDESILMPINFFNGETNPYVAQISTKKKIGWTNSDGVTTENTSLGMTPYLAIYETEPVTSNLDIYWETSTSGLISELNYNIATIDNTVPCDITDPSINWSEADPPGTIISDLFKAVACNGTELDALADDTTIDLISVKNGLNHEKVHEFKLVQPNPAVNEYYIEIPTNPNWEGFFLAWNDNNRRTWTFTFEIKRPSTNFSMQTTRVAQVQNANPGQIGMFDTSPGNNARDEMKAAIFNMDKQYMNYHNGGEWTATNPNYVIVGDWQNDNPYNNDVDNAYWSTFGRNYIDPLPNSFVFYPSGDMGYGPGDVGQQDFFPTGLVSSSEYNNPKPKKGYVYPPNTPTKDFSKYLNRKIKMIKAPSAADIAWDGTFKAYNGAYGTVAGSPWPVNLNRGQELVFEVIRAYQVSCFYPLQIDAAFDDGAHLTAYGKWGIGEIVFSKNSVTGKPEPLVSALPDMGAGKIQTRTNTYPSPYVNGATYGDPDRMPPGPVYWNFKRQPQLTNCQNIWPASGTAITDPKDYNTGGEPSVLNNYPIAPQAHYWKDLSDAITIDGHTSLQRIWTVDEFQPLTPAGMPCYFGQDRLDDYTQVPRRGFWYVRDMCTTSMDPDQQHHIRTTFHLAQVTWQDMWGSVGSTSPSTWNHDPCFVIENDPPPLLGSGDPQTATLRTSGEYPVPPGRYVVTVRVTDRTIPNSSYDGYLARQNPNHASGDGLYFEWDVPVIINGPFAQTIRSGQFTWVNTSPTGKPRDWKCNTFGWDNGLGEAPWYNVSQY